MLFNTLEIIFSLSIENEIAFLTSWFDNALFEAVFIAKKVCSLPFSSFEPYPIVPIYSCKLSLVVEIKSIFPNLKLLYNSPIEEYKFIDYIKIPHHGSKGSDTLMKKFVNLCGYSPSVAATTGYRQHKLPNQEILELYKGYKGIELYSTGSIANFEKEKKQYGIIRTTFDVLEKRKFCIETHLYGNAISIE